MGRFVGDLVGDAVKVGVAEGVEVMVGLGEGCSFIPCPQPNIENGKTSIPRITIIYKYLIFIGILTLNYFLGYLATTVVLKPPRDVNSPMTSAHSGLQDETRSSRILFTAFSLKIPRFL